MALQCIPRMLVRASAPAPSLGDVRRPPWPVKSVPRRLAGVTLRSGGLLSAAPGKRDVTREAKFQEFGGSKTLDDEAYEETAEEGDGEDEDEEQVEDSQEDSVLPNDLEDAVIQSAQAAALYIGSGGTRAITELLLPELENLNEDGAQEKLWNLSRLFLETLQEALGMQRVKAIFPDAGSAALVKSRWGEVSFGFGSCNDRRPVSIDDELVVLVAPDYQMLTDVQRIASFLADDADGPGRPLVMWNPRLVSGDVGIGLNVRRMRESFLSTFTIVYSMRPLSFGAIFRKYPGLWQVFLDDKERPGRYLLSKELVRRPDPDDLDVLFFSGGRDDNEESEPSLLAKVLGPLASFSRFLKSLSN